MSFFGLLQSFKPVITVLNPLTRYGWQAGGWALSPSLLSPPHWLLKPTVTCAPVLRSEPGGTGVSKAVDPPV